MSFVSSTHRPCPGTATQFPHPLSQKFKSVDGISFPKSTLTCSVSSSTAQTKKHQLLTIIQETQRGLTATTNQRSIIEEAFVELECCKSEESIDLVKLDGTWRMQYTTASDVLVLLEAASKLPFLEIGQIFQKFECSERENNGGVVRNVIQWSIPTLLEEQDGATLVVSATFSVVSNLNIQLRFQEVSVQDIKISALLQNVVAPAMLPRSFFSLQILQFIRSFRAQLPLESPVNSERASVGGLYYLSYLDNNILLGRQVGSGGVFVFTKTQPLII